jgi:hypothetical protein
MKSGSTKASDQCLPIDRWPNREPKLTGLTTCLGASADATYVTRAKGPIATTTHEVGRNPRQSPNQIRVCEDCNRVRNLSCL